MFDNDLIRGLYVDSPVEMTKYALACKNTHIITWVIDGGEIGAHHFRNRVIVKADNLDILW